MGGTMNFNESWKLDGQPPSVEDCRKYARCSTRLLASVGESHIFEGQISQVTPGGIARICQQVSGWVAFGDAGMWVSPDMIKIYEILPDLELPSIFKSGKATKGERKSH